MGLQRAGVLGAVGLSLSGMYAFTGLGIPCPWRHLTNTLCPFCGSTGLGAALLRGDIGAAWAANQLVFVLLVGLAIACAFWLIELLGGPAFRLPRRFGDHRLWYIALGTVAVLFAVVRNLVPLG